MTSTAADDAAERLLTKLRAFAAGLTDDEREVFAALVGPGVAMAHRDEDDVEGFTSTWEPRRLPERLSATIREHDVRVVGL